MTIVVTLSKRSNFRVVVTLNMGHAVTQLLNVDFPGLFVEENMDMDLQAFPTDTMDQVNNFS